MLSGSPICGWEGEDARLGREGSWAAVFSGKVSANSMGTLSLGCFFRDAFIVKNGLSFVLLHGLIVETDLPQEVGRNG